MLVLWGNFGETSEEDWRHCNFLGSWALLRQHALDFREGGVNLAT